MSLLDWCSIYSKGWLNLWHSDAAARCHKQMRMPRLPEVPQLRVFAGVTSAYALCLRHVLPVYF